MLFMYHSGVTAFFFNHAATPALYPLSLHDALPILKGGASGKPAVVPGSPAASPIIVAVKWGDENLRMPPKVLIAALRSEEHTSELQSQSNLVCRLLLGNKKVRAHDEDPTRQQT